MKLEILHDEIRIVPEGAADEVYLRHIAGADGPARTELVKQILLSGAEEIRFLSVKPCYEPRSS